MAAACASHSDGRLPLARDGAPCVYCEVRAAVLAGPAEDGALARRLAGVELTSFELARHEGVSLDWIAVYQRLRGGLRLQSVEVRAMWQARELLAQRTFEYTEEGLERALGYARELWPQARLGPCPCVGRLSRARLGRLRLACSGQCSMCTIRRAIVEGPPSW